MSKKSIFFIHRVRRVLAYTLYSPKSLDLIMKHNKENQGKGKKRKAPSKQNWKEKSQAGSSSNGPKGKASYDARMPLILRRLLAFTTMTRGIGNKAAPSTCKT